MKCYHPIRIRNPDPMKISGEFLDVPCGKCPACRSNHREQWSYRCERENESCNFSYFMTYTYDDNNIPVLYPDPNTGELLLERGLSPPPRFSSQVLLKSDFQLYMKRLRKDMDKLGITCRFYACGEYGSHTYRPHYHMLLWLYFTEYKGLKFNRNSVENIIFNNWKYGHVKFGEVTSLSIRYTLKDMIKQVGKSNSYVRYEIAKGIPCYLPFSLMSRRPGIGFYWYKKYEEGIRTKVYLQQSLVSAGHKVGVPRYYKDKLDFSKLFKKYLNDQLEKQTEIRDKRIASALGLTYYEYMEKKFAEQQQTELQKIIRQNEKTGKF